MKTRDTDYGKFFPLDRGGFPEDYPFATPFHEHIKRVGGYLIALKKDLSLDDVFLAEMEKYRAAGFETFYVKCMRQYRRIFNLRLKRLEEGCD